MTKKLYDNPTFDFTEARRRNEELKRRRDEGERRQDIEELRRRIFEIELQSKQRRQEARNAAR